MGLAFLGWLGSNIPISQIACALSGLYPKLPTLFDDLKPRASRDIVP
jgi:hypothetical protein